MNERYVFIDESGDLGEKGSKTFVITAVWVEDPVVFERIIKNMRRNKFKKELKSAQELKANKSGKDLIIHLLKKVNEIEHFHAQSIILNKEKNYSKFLKDDKNKLYNYVCGQMAASLNIDSKHLIIRVDKSKGKQALQDDFNNYIKMKLLEGKWNRTVEVFHSWSHSWPGLQIADFVSWAVYQKYEHDNDSYIKLIDKKTSFNVIWS